MSGTACSVSSPPHKKVAVEYGVDEAFDSQNSPYFTATDGRNGLEAQVGGHAFDGELGAGHGMDDRERAVNNIVNDTPKWLFNSPRSSPNV